MKKMLFYFLLIPSISWAQKKETWPGVPFSTVRVYMYNILGDLWGNHSVVKDGSLDPTVWDTGVALNRTQEARLVALFNQDIALLQEGLGKCYIPHHGFVFYDAAQKPVAWASVCFMCDGAKVYFPEKKDKPAKYNPVNEKKVLVQMQELKAIVEETGLPVFKFPEQYLEYFQKKQAEKEKNKMTVINEKFINDVFFKEVNHKNIYGFVNADSSKVTIREDHKFTAGGDPYYFYDGKFNNSTFRFSGVDETITRLDKAVVKDFEVKLINKITIGMAYDELLSGILTEGIDRPDEVIITNEKKSKKIILRFINGYLQEYEMIDEGW